MSLIIVTVILSIIILCCLSYYLKYFVPLRGKESGFKYVHVENDGSVRELNEDEKKYLTEVFAPNDGSRPYIKYRFSDFTPDGKLSGYILRRRVPRKLSIKPLLNKAE